ncbi:MAG TPA: UDP-N-acetyl glucosamine 2-epimerase [Gemmatimonadales bacterium]|jgi:UDP-N-acetylglucosamine 2-epimerase|nr:UDP-N-acetyl glucosamine 2-epimerase [Gemmatimonadales bacterium]
MIALCYGTRPQIIKASILRRALEKAGPLFTVDTGQHYDFVMNGLLYQQLGVSPPDHFLEVGSGTHARQTAAILIGIETLVIERRPDALVVIGDTNSTLGSGLAAAKAGVPVVHVEAGLRAQDAGMAEEINRRLVDTIADLLCTPSRAVTERVRAARPDATVVDTGDVALDVLKACRDRLPDVSSLIPENHGKGYVFATLHRAELTADPAVLKDVVTALGNQDYPVLLALHPRTRAVLDDLGETRTRIGQLWIREPVGYLESLALIGRAAAVVTDSGGVQREAYWSGVPCVTIRTETEWLETIEAGANVLVPPRDAVAGLAAALNGQLKRWAHASWDRGAYGQGNAGDKVTQAITSWLAD